MGTSSDEGDFGYFARNSSLAHRPRPDAGRRRTGASFTSELQGRGLRSESDGQCSSISGERTRGVLLVERAVTSREGRARFQRPFVARFSGTRSSLEGSAVVARSEISR